MSGSGSFSPLDRRSRRYMPTFRRSRCATSIIPLRAPLVFTVRRYALHGICYSNSVCPSVRLSVCLSAAKVLREIYPLDPFPFPPSPPQAPPSLTPSPFSLPCPLLLFYPPLPRPSSLPFPPLRSRIPLNPARRSGGVLYVSFPSGAETQPKSNLVHFCINM